MKYFVRYRTADQVVSAWEDYRDKPPPRINRACHVRPTVVQSELVDFHEIPMRTYERRHHEYRDDAHYFDYEERLHNPSSRKPTFEEELMAVVGRGNLSNIKESIEKIRRRMGGAA